MTKWEPLLTDSDTGGHARCAVTRSGPSDDTARLLKVKQG